MGVEFFALLAALALYAMLIGTVVAALMTALAWLSLLDTKRRLREHEQSRRRD